MTRYDVHESSVSESSISNVDSLSLADLTPSSKNPIEKYKY